MALSRSLVFALACGVATLLVALNATVGFNSTLQVLRGHARTTSPCPSLPSPPSPHSQVSSRNVATTGAGAAAAAAAGAAAGAAAAAAAAEAAHTHAHTPPRTSTFIQEGSSNVRYFSKTTGHLMAWGVRAMEKALDRIAAQNEVKAAMADESDESNAEVRDGFKSSAKATKADKATTDRSAQAAAASLLGNGMDQRSGSEGEHSRTPSVTPPSLGGARARVRAPTATSTARPRASGIRRHRRALIRRKFRICIIQNLLLQVLNALKGCGIPHCVEGGTLMGFWRHGGIMPWDSDADVMFFGGADDVEPMVRCLRDSPAFDSSMVIVATTLKKHKGGFVPVKVAHAGSGLYVDVWGPAVNDTSTRTVSFWDGAPVGSTISTRFSRFAQRRIAMFRFPFRCQPECATLYLGSTRVRTHPFHRRAMTMTAR